MNIKINNQLINTKSANWHKLGTQNNSSQWWVDIIDFLQQWANNSETIKIETSGSTGIPKVILVQKKHMLASANNTCKYFNLNNKSTALLCLSANYIAGKMMLVRAMASGMNLICVKPSENPVKELNAPIDFAAMVPMQVQQSIAMPQKFNLIKQLIIGGAKVNNLLIAELKKHNVIAYETFGMTETLSHIAVKQIAPVYKNFFMPLNGINISQDHDNKMVIDYPQLDIYKLKTNDVINLIDDSGSFEWRGRTDFIINSGGVKILPEEIENKIVDLIILPYCIVGLPDKKLGEKAVLVIMGKPFNTTNLSNKLTTLLTPYYCPKNILFIDRFPLTNSGKIERDKLIKKVMQII